MNEPRTHLPEIDWLKGFSILGVICIHAKVYSDSFFFLQVLNRAVHTFLVLFGISSELWWRREVARAPEHVTRRWYVGRLSRIVPGYWAMTAIWWLVVALYKKPPGDLELGAFQALVSVTGYAPWIGTSWFVLVILEYILIFPVLRRAVLAMGALPSLLIAAVSTFASCWFLLQIVTVGKALLGNNVPWPGWYYQWIFMPRVLWDVVAGIFVAHLWRGRISAKTTWIALGLTALGIVLTHVVRGGTDRLGPVREMAVNHIVDVPLSIALLGLFRMAPLPEPVRRSLAFLGLWSWGIYLSHLLVHELVQIAGYSPFTAEQSVRMGYALFLLVTGIGLALLADRAEKLLWARRGRSRLSSPA